MSRGFSELFRKYYLTSTDIYDRLHVSGRTLQEIDTMKFNEFIKQVKVSDVVRVSDTFLTGRPQWVGQVTEVSAEVVTISWSDGHEPSHWGSDNTRDTDDFEILNDES